MTRCAKTKITTSHTQAINVFICQLTINPLCSTVEAFLFFVLHLKASKL